MSCSLSFTDLPKNVRLKIYLFSGIRRPCPIDLRHEGLGLQQRREKELRHVGPRFYTGEILENILETACVYRLRRQRKRKLGGETKDCWCATLPTQWPYVSKSIHEEVLPLIFSLNKFKVEYRCTSSLRPLYVLNHRALNCMSYLHIRLNLWPCPFGHDEMDERNFECLRCRGREKNCTPPLAFGENKGMQTFKVWQAICERLSETLPPDQLDLSFVCDVQDYATAKQVVLSMAYLPRLKGCAIRLGRDPTPDLDRLARKTALKLMYGRNRPLDSFSSYSKLPTEIRFQIPSHTALRVPNVIDFYREEECIQIINNKVYYLEHCCHRCTSTYEACCCPSKHAAYSATCECIRPPMCLLSLSKQSRGDALQVLFSSNCIRFFQQPAKTLDFLRNLPAFSLPYFRHIQIKFHHGHIEEWFQTGLHDHWQALVKWMEANLNLSNLRLMLDCNRAGCDAHWADSVEENKYLYDAFRDILDTLCILKGLRSFYVYLDWFQDLEPMAEAELMGPDYDSWADGKHGKTRWHERPSSFRDIPSHFISVRAEQRVEQCSRKCTYI